MRDLHVYVDSEGSETQGEQTAFYSRRADGPYYLWLDAEGVGRWSYSRVKLDRLTLRVLCVARWEVVPPALRKRLGEHYLE